MQQTQPTSSTGDPTNPPEIGQKKEGDAGIKQLQAQKPNPVITRPIILGDLTLASPTTQVTIGANGSASAMPTPLGYILVNIGNAQVALAYFNAS